MTGSLLYTFCWRGVKKSGPARKVAMLVPENKMFPVQHRRFYTTLTLPTPADPKWYMEAEWGGDVMRSIKSKDLKRGTFDMEWAIKPGRLAPPMPVDIVALENGVVNHGTR